MNLTTKKCRERLLLHSINLYLPLNIGIGENVRISIIYVTVNLLKFNIIIFIGISAARKSAEKDF